MKNYITETLLQLTVFTLMAIMLQQLYTIPEPLLIINVGWLFILTLMGGGWPFTIPLGKVFKETWKSGLFMTLILLLTSLTTFLFLDLLPNVDVRFFGPFFVWLSAVWGFALESWPLRHYTPKIGLVVGSSVMLVLGFVLAVVFQNLLDYELLVDYIFWDLFLLLVFSPMFVFQGYPFYRFFRQPRVGLSLTIFSLVASLIITNYLSRIHFLRVFISSAILLAVLYSWGLAYPLVLKYRQPIRGVITLVASLVLAFFWSSAFLLLFDAQKIITINLFIVLPTLVIHNTFWMRKPFQPPLLLGMPHQNQMKIDKLREWILQIMSQ